MKKAIKIVPAILAKDGADFNRQYKHLAKHFNYFQVDIADGILVDNRTRIRPSCLKKVGPGKKLEIHLMVKNVPVYARGWSDSKKVKKIIWHYEANHDHDEILKLNKFLKRKKIQTGLAINPPTSLGSIAKLIPHFHTIQVMGIKPGKMGRKFKPTVLKKIKALRQKYPNLNIEVDGGVKPKNFKAITKAGANIIALGSYFKDAEDPKEALDKLK